MSSSESEQEPALPLEGITFLVHGPQAGRTRSQMVRAIEANGGSVTKHTTSDYLTHIICSPQLWSRQGSAGADPTIRRVVAANGEENRPNHNGVWLLPLEWLDECVEKGRKVSELGWDFERNEHKRRAERAKELAQERKENKGKFKRGERRRFEREQRIKQEIAEQAKLEAAGPVVGDAAAFSGMASTANDAVSPSTPYELSDSRQPKRDLGTTAPPQVASAMSSSPPVASSSVGAASDDDEEEEVKRVEHELKEPDPKRFPNLPTLVSRRRQAQAKPVVKVNRTYIKPTPATSAATGKPSMWGNTRRQAPKPGSSAPKANGDGGKAQDKGKGKARASDDGMLELSSSEDEPLVRKAQNGPGAGSGDAKGKKRALVLSSDEDDKRPTPTTLKSDTTRSTRKAQKAAEPSSSELSSLEED